MCLMGFLAPCTRVCLCCWPFFLLMAVFEIKTRSVYQLYYAQPPSLTANGRPHTHCWPFFFADGSFCACGRRHFDVQRVGGKPRELPARNHHPAESVRFPGPGGVTLSSRSALTPPRLSVLPWPGWSDRNHHPAESVRAPPPQHTSLKNNGWKHTSLKNDGWKGGATAVF